MGLVFITQDVKNVLSDPRGSVIADDVFSTLLLRQSGKSQPSTTQTQQLVAEQLVSRPRSSGGSAPRRLDTGYCSWDPGVSICK